MTKCQWLRANSWLPMTIANSLMPITNYKLPMTKWPKNISISSQFSYELDSIELHSCFKLFLRKKLLSSPILNCYLNCEEMREKSDASKDCQLDNEIVQIYQWFFLKNSLISIVVLHKCPYFASVFLTTLVFLQNFFRMIFNSKTINSTHCSVSALYLFLKFCSQF